MRSMLNIAVVLSILLTRTHAAPSVPRQATQAVTSVTPLPSLWQPKTINGKVLKWNYIINGSVQPIDDTADVYDVDLFETSDEDLKELRAKGKKIICYFSAGSLELWRNDWNSLEFDLINGTDYGPGLEGWEGEYWFNTRSQKVRKLMTSRINHAVTRGCDAIEPDNVDAFDNDEASPMGLDVDSARDYLKFLVNTTAHPLNLAVGLKNALKLVDDASWWLDFEVNEECVSPPPKIKGGPRGENECADLTPFVAKGKPVFHVEYDQKVPGGVKEADIKKYCDKTTTGFSNVIKRKDLDENTLYCP